MANSSDNPKPGNWFSRHKILSLIGVIILIVIIASAAGSGSNEPASQPAKADKDKTAATTTTTPNTAAHAATPQVLLDLSGNGTKQTQTFSAASDWDLEWSYDCSDFGSQGNFIVSIYNKDGTPSYQNSDVNQLGQNGSDVQHYHKGGSFYLDISSECSWHVTVKG